MRVIKYFIILLFVILTIQSKAQDTLRYSEVFDFDIGDEFHYEKNFYHLNGFQILRYNILDKWYSELEDTLYYKVLRNEYTALEFSPVPTETTTEELWIYTDLDHLITPYDGFTTVCTPANTCIVETDFNTYCDHETMTIKIRSGLIGFEENRESLSFGKGLGIIASDLHFDDGNYGEYQVMIYFKKGIEICGTANYVSSLDRIKRDFFEYKIAPNPMEDQFKITSPSNQKYAYKLILYHVLGQVVFVDDNYQIDTYIQLQDIPKGIYLVELKSREGVLFRDLIKKN